MKITSTAVIEKIKKLLELASSANKEDHERKLAMDRAQALMVKYSVSEAELAEKENRSLEIVQEEYFNPTLLKQGVIQVIPSIIAVITPIFGVYGMAQTIGGKPAKFVLVGFKTNVDIARYALDSILAQGVATIRAEYKKYRTITFSVSFWSGYLIGLTEKFKTNLSNSKDIVVYDRVKQFLKNIAGDKPISADLTSGIAYQTGYEAGLEAEIRKPIEQTNNKLLL